MPNKGTRYSEEFKKSIVTLHESGKSISHLSREYGLTWTTIDKWVKLYSEVKLDSDTTISASQIKELQKRNAQLEEENIILKKAIAIFTPNSRTD